MFSLLSLLKWGSSAQKGRDKRAKGQGREIKGKETRDRDVVNRGGLITKGLDNSDDKFGSERKGWQCKLSDIESL